MKKLFRLLFHRIILIGVFIAVQLAAIVLMIWQFSDYFMYFYGINTVIGLVLVLFIINGNSNPGYKIAWIIPVLLFPIFGVLFYILFGNNRLNKHIIKKMESIKHKLSEALSKIKPSAVNIFEQNKTAQNQSAYISKYAYCPPYQNTVSEYLPLGEVKFERLKEALKQANNYIFLEYFIIEEGLFWGSVLDILKEKAAQGVDVRVIYDDFGCLMLLPYDYDKKLENMGIKCCIFNPFIPILSSRLNNRDHRKIAVIDGIIGFMGGINLADEYINVIKKHGHWKDTAIMLKGEAVWSLTVMFLSMWDYLRDTNDDYNKYLPDYKSMDLKSDGIVQPFTDSPLDKEPVSETVYMNIISKAKKYVYISTPYLIIDNELVSILSIASKSGVDIRILTPHIPDKWYVHIVTRAYYQTLLQAGIRIYEYTPGFMHAKSFVSDDEFAVVGSINLDYRSLYLHFECATWLYKTESVMQIKDDFLKTLEVSQEITLENCNCEKWYIKMTRAVLRVFSPLM